jgi:hypothetical protein
MAKIELKPEEALVLVHFLMRFRDKEVLATEHPAEDHILWDLCALLESQVPELLDPEYQEKLERARGLVTSDDWE